MIYYINLINTTILISFIPNDITIKLSAIYSANKSVVGFFVTIHISVEVTVSVRNYNTVIKDKALIDRRNSLKNLPLMSHMF